MEMVAVEESNGGGNCMVARGASAVRLQDTVAGKPAEQQCEHFSIRGYVSLVQKKDPKFCSLSQIFHDQQQYDERYNSPCPFSIAKFRRWDCLKCLDKVKSSDHRTTSRTVSVKQDDTSDCCSISFVRSVDSKRLLACTQQSSQGKNADRSTLSKSAQESNSKRNSPSGNKGVTEENTDPLTKDLQGSSYNHESTSNISDNASVDVTALPEVSQIRANKEGNGTEIPCNPKLSEVTLTPNADENGKNQEILIADCNMTNVPKPIPGQKGDEVCNSGPCEEAAPKRSVKSNCKKKKDNKPTVQIGAPDVKICRRKPKKVRLLSEIINTNQVGRSRSDIEVDHEKVADLCEDDRSRDAVPPVSHQTVGEIQSKTTKNKTKYKGVDVVDDGSSLMNWLKITHKKLRTEKKDSERKDFDSCAANSKSTVEIFASKDMRHNFLSSVGNLSKKKMLPTTSTQQGDVNIQNNYLEINMQKTDDMQQIESENSTQRCLSKAKTMSLSKRKMPSTANAQHGDENTENNTGKRTILRTDYQCQMESENSMQKCLSKVSLGKRDIQNVTGLLEKKLPKKRKKQKLELMHEKQAIIDDIPMDIVELLARNQRERQLMTETDSFEISHTQSKMTADDDCPIVAADDGPNYASTVLDTNFQQKSLASESKQKALQVHVASSTQVTSTHPPKLQIPGHLKSTQEGQSHLRMEEVVTIAASSPIFSQHKDQYIAEAPAESWSHRGTRKLMWDSFNAAPRDSSIAACGSEFRHNIRAVDLTSTHVTGASNDYSTHQPVIAALDYCTKRAVNQVPARSFPSAISTMEASNLCDRRNAGQSSFYPKETMPATHLLRLMDSSTLAGFPNYETSNRNQMEFQLRNSQYTHNQYKGSTSTSYGSNLNGKVPLTLEDLSRHKLQPLTLEDLSCHQLQPNLHRPLRPNPRVGVLPSFLQEEIANWSENCGTQSGYRIGVSKGITLFDMNKKEKFEALNSGMFSAKWNALQLGSVSSNSEFLSARNSIAQSWTRGKGKMTHPLDKFVKHDICVTNRNPAEFTAISDDNEYMMSL